MEFYHDYLKFAMTDKHQLRAVGRKPSIGVIMINTATIDIVQDYKQILLPELDVPQPLFYFHVTGITISLDISTTTSMCSLYRLPAY